VPKPFDSRDFVLVNCSAFQAKGFNQIGRRKVIAIRYGISVKFFPLTHKEWMEGTLG